METKKPEYKGPDALVTIVGQSSVDSVIGTVGGMTAGAVVGALMHNKNKHTEMHALANSAKTFKEFLNKDGFIKTTWHSMGRGGKALFTAAGIGLIVGSITQITGYFRGANKAEEARKQFDEITSENQILQQKLEAANAQLEQNKSFVDTLKAERTAPAATKAI